MTVGIFHFRRNFFAGRLGKLEISRIFGALMNSSFLGELASKRELRVSSAILPNTTPRLSP